MPFIYPSSCIFKESKRKHLLINCSFKNHLNKTNNKCCWFNVVNDQCHAQTSLSLWKIYMQRKVGRRKRARGASPFPNLWSLALCYQSLACHVHFVLASMQKMKLLRRKNGHLLKLSLIESINPFLASWS